MYKCNANIFDFPIYKYIIDPYTLVIVPTCILERVTSRISRRLLHANRFLCYYTYDQNRSYFNCRFSNRLET